MVYNVAEPLFSKPTSDVRERKHIKPAWMNQECENVRDYFLQKVNVFRLNQLKKIRKKWLKHVIFILVKPGDIELIRLVNT